LGPACDVLTEGGNDAGNLQAHGFRDALRRRVEALALQQVAAVNAGRLHLDEDFPRARFRCGDLGPFNAFRAGTMAPLGVCLVGRADGDRMHVLSLPQG
ncbi:hypothetical protein BGV04_19925, partial [Clostridioides difficile]